MDEQRDFISEAVDTGAFIWALPLREHVSK